MPRHLGSPCVTAEAVEASGAVGAWASATIAAAEPIGDRSDLHIQVAVVSEEGSEQAREEGSSPILNTG